MKVTIEKDVNMFKVNTKDTRTSLLLTINTYQIFF